MAFVFADLMVMHNVNMIAQTQSQPSQRNMFGLLKVEIEEMARTNGQLFSSSSQAAFWAHTLIFFV